MEKMDPNNPYQQPYQPNNYPPQNMGGTPGLYPMDQNNPYQQQYQQPMMPAQPMPAGNTTVVVVQQQSQMGQNYVIHIPSNAERTQTFTYSMCDCGGKNLGLYTFFLSR